MDFGFWNLDFGFGIFGFWILDFGIWDLGFWILDFGFLDFRILDFGFCFNLDMVAARGHWLYGTSEKKVSILSILCIFVELIFR